MAKVRITWQRTCEYVADVDTAELRLRISQLPATAERDYALEALGRIDAGEPWQYDEQAVTYILGNTETGREWLGAMADDNPGYLGGTGAPEAVTVHDYFKPAT